MEHKEQGVDFVARQTDATSSGDKQSVSILRNKDRTMTCSHCGQHGHEKKYCWELIGFPGWWNERSERGAAGRGSRTCGENNGGGRGRGPASAAH